MGFYGEIPVVIKQQVMQLIETPTLSTDLLKYAGLILHPIMRLLDVREMQTLAMDALAALIEPQVEAFYAFSGQGSLQERVSQPRYNLLVA